MILSNNMEDREFIEGFLKGEEACFDKIVLKYKGVVFNFCFRMLGDYEEALDVSQDIFIKVYGSLKNFRHEARFSTYLYRIVVNFCKNRLKAMQRSRKKRAFSLDDPVKTEEGEIKRDIADGNPGPREILDSKEDKGAVEEAVNSLNGEHREIIILREIEGLSYEDIADILKLDMGTVKSRLNRARVSLKEKLEGIL